MPSGLLCPCRLGGGAEELAPTVSSGIFGGGAVDSSLAMRAARSSTLAVRVSTVVTIVVAMVVSS
jgi:hypothetical protein